VRADRGICQYFCADVAAQQLRNPLDREKGRRRKGDGGIL